MMVFVCVRFSGCLQSDSTCRQPFGKARPRDPVLRHAEADGTRHNPDRGFPQLYQRLQISDVLCCERNEDKSLHSKRTSPMFVYF